MTLKLILRNTKRNLLPTSIIIAGLVIVMVFSFLIVSWIKYEKSYDTWYSNHDRLYRCTFNFFNENTTYQRAFLPRTYIQYFDDFFPEVEGMTRFTFAPWNVTIKTGNKNFIQNRLIGADSNFFELFNVALLQGDGSQVLDDPWCAVLSESLARQYFGTTDCVGKKLDLWFRGDDEFFIYTVKGIMPDFPANTHFHPEIVISIEDQTDYTGRNYTYILLKEGSSIKAVEANLEAFKKKHFSENFQKHETVDFQKVDDIHFYSHKQRELEQNGNHRIVPVLSIVGLILFLIVMLNNTNLQLASVQKRGKLIMVNRVFGSGRYQALVYLLLETTLYIAVATLFSIGILMLSQQPIERVFNIDISFPFKEQFFIFGIILLTVIIFSYVSNWYLFLMIGRYRKSGSAVNRAGARDSISLAGQAIKGDEKIRKILVFAQFAASIALIVVTMGIFKQMKFMATNKMGDGSNNIIHLQKLTGQVVEQYELFKEELKKHSSIIDVTATMDEPSGETNDNFQYAFDGKRETDKHLYILCGDYNMGEFYNMKLLAGEGLTKDVRGEGTYRYVVNEQAMKKLGHTNPQDIIGKQFDFEFNFNNLFPPGYISGVVEDFHFSTMEQEVKPIVMCYENFFSWCFSIKHHPQQTQQAIADIHKTWNNLFPNHPLRYHFMDDMYHNLYAGYYKQMRFMGLLLVIMLCISLAGLFGVVSYAVSKRIKEIGVRKVNGAKVSEVLMLINKDFVTWLLIAFFVACPVGWLGLNQWLKNFAYRTPVSWGIFLLAGVAVLSVAILTITLRAWKAARKNPVEALRYE